MGCFFFLGGGVAYFFTQVHPWTPVAFRVSGKSTVRDRRARNREQYVLVASRGEITRFFLQIVRFFFYVQIGLPRPSRRRPTDISIIRRARYFVLTVLGGHGDDDICGNHNSTSNIILTMFNTRVTDEIIWRIRGRTGQGGPVVVKNNNDKTNEIFSTYNTTCSWCEILYRVFRENVPIAISPEIINHFYYFFPRGFHGGRGFRILAF